MSTIKQGTIDLPAYWASALINNDWTGIDDTDTGPELSAWLKANPSLCVEGCSDVSYIGRYRGGLCDMLTYSYTERVS